MIQEEMDPLVKIGMLLMFAALVGLHLGLLHTLSYTLSDHALRIACGPIGMSVPLDTIESVTYGLVKKGLTWSWALTFKGLIIARRGKLMRVAIAPLDRDEFMRDLAQRCPHLDLRDGSLTPVTQHAANAVHDTTSDN